MKQEQKSYQVGTAEWHDYINSCWQPGPRGSKKPLSEIFSFNQFKDKRCFVIGGGPSLRGFDFTLLKTEYTIGINRIIKVFHPWILCSWDIFNYNWIKTQLIKSIVVMVDVSNSNFDRVFYVRSAGDFGAPTQIDRIYIGTHTGYAAINLALAMGFNPIYLLGFDYKPNENGKYHVTDNWYHAKEPQGNPKDIDQRLERFRKEIDRYPEYLKNREIINLNLDSELKSFKKKSITEVFNGDIAVK